MSPGQEVSKEKIMEVLKTCFDPEIPINIVDLGLIYGIDIKDGKVYVTMTLTSLGCPLSSFLEQDIKTKVGDASDAKGIEINLVWDPPWSPERMTKEARQALGI